MCLQQGRRPEAWFSRTCAGPVWPADALCWCLGTRRALDTASTGCPRRTPSGGKSRPTKAECKAAVIPSAGHDGLWRPGGPAGPFCACAHVCCDVASLVPPACLCCRRALLCRRPAHDAGVPRTSGTPCGSHVLPGPRPTLLLLRPGL